MRPRASHSPRHLRRSASTPAAVWYRSSALFARSFITRALSGLGTVATRSRGGARRRALARKPRRHAEPGQPDLARGAVHEDVGWFQVLVDEPALVEPSERGGEADG